MSHNAEPENKIRKQWIRFSKLLASRMDSGLSYEIDGEDIFVEVSDRKHKFQSHLFRQMLVQCHVELVNERVRLTGSGLLELKNRLGLSFSESQCGARAADLGTQDTNHGKIVRVNTNESPLVRLYRRKSSSGSSYISENELRAGEQLRRDFERGQLQPKISANLERSIGKSGKHSANNQVGEISDFALDARARVNRAMQVLGPELAGVTIDICCFLKGLELVERERQWPPRSAKLMLRTALSMLAKHYGFEQPARPENSAIQFWGTEDYRPNLHL